MVDRVLKNASPPPLTPIGRPSLYEGIEAVGGGEVEDLIQSFVRVLETPNAIVEEIKQNSGMCNGSVGCVEVCIRRNLRPREGHLRVVPLDIPYIVWELLTSHYNLNF